MIYLSNNQTLRRGKNRERRGREEKKYRILDSYHRAAHRGSGWWCICTVEFLDGIKRKKILLYFNKIFSNIVYTQYLQKKELSLIT
jgi:hypothetical protein